MEHRSGAPLVEEGVDKLCDSCINLPLTEEDLSAALGKDVRPSYTIGTLSEIRLRRQCPMCRFLLAAFLNDPQSKRFGSGHEASDNVFQLTWQNHRKGFECPQLPSMGTRLSFVRDEDVSTFGQGRRISTQQIDTELVMGWLRRCQQEHGTECEAEGRIIKDTNSTTLKLPSRLIDVRTRCIVASENPNSYVTLSYVWGKAKTLRLSRQNKDLLAKPFIMDSLETEIPRTIVDAMALVAQLGYAYLWVDALCIVQDDDEEFAREIQHMDFIYRNSAFTIIAAHGNDADAGLSGVRARSRQIHQVVERIGPNASLIALYELDDLLRTQVYSTRGWTVQERILSRRNVVFVNGQVFFQCQLRTWSEDTWYESKPSNATPDDPWGSLLGMALSKATVPYHSFCYLLMYYCERELSYESDALRAAVGLLRMLAARLGSGILQGLPTLNLDAYLIFFAKGDSNPDTKASISKLFLGWVESQHWRPVLLAHAVLDLPEVVLDKATLKSAARERLQSEIPSIKYEIEHTATTINTGNLACRIPYPFLLFWTVSIQLRVLANANSAVRESAIFDLVDKDFSFCGYVWYDKHPWHDSESSLELILLSETNYGHEEFPILETNYPSNPSKRYDQQVQLDWEARRAVRDADGEESAEGGTGSEQYHRPSPNFYHRLVDRWDLYWVMLIEWDNGIAERRGIGQIYKTAAESSFPPGPVWKQIILA